MPKNPRTSHQVSPPTHRYDIKTERRRNDDLRKADRYQSKRDIHHVEAMAKMRATYENKLRKGEAKRINAIRTVDVGAAGTLAKQVSDAAETLRTTVEAARQAQEIALNAALNPIKTDLAELNRKQYEQAGQRSAADDPVLKALGEMQRFQIEERTRKETTVEQRRAGFDAKGLWIGILGVVGVVALIISPHIH